MLVVMPDVGAHDLLELAPTDDQDPIEAFPAQASHPALGVRLRLWRPHRRLDHPDAFGAEDLVEAARELAVPVTNERRRTGSSRSTVRKSQAMIEDACARRNSDQVSSARRGAGSIPCRRRIAQIVLGASATPRPTSSPWMRR
jgi:hypothetical protein